MAPYLLPPLQTPPASTVSSRPAPDEAQCRAWWNDYAMPEHIQAHSRAVALVAGWVADRGEAAGVAVRPDLVRASALLHDLAKAYTIQYGGNHSQIGAAWTMELTGEPVVAQGVMHHVYWPFELNPDEARRHFLPLCVLYGDKRVAHHRIVDMETRFQDLLDRYGRTEAIRKSIYRTHVQALEIERLLGEIIGEDPSCASF